MSESLAETLWRAARRARENAYAPYSGYRVGAALKARGADDVYTGCNVENASYGATMCAERAAVFGMIAARGRAEPEMLALVTEGDPPAVPCALCLQVLAEFGAPDLPIVLGSPEGIRETVALRDLLPRPFAPAALAGRPPE
jgi:cytidine deaminase